MKNYLSTQECGNIKRTSMKMVCKVGMTQWNRNGFEFIWWYQTFLIIKKEDGLDEKNFFCVLTLLFLCPVGCLSLTVLSTYLRGPESASIEIPLFRTHFIKVKKNSLFFQIGSDHTVLLHLGIMTLGYKRCNKCLVCYISCMRYSRSHS